MFYLLIIVAVTYSVCHCQLDNVKFLCRYKNINGEPFPSLSYIMRSVLDCCGAASCGGISISGGQQPSFDTIKPEWFTHRNITPETVYFIKKRQTWILKGPEVEVVYKLTANFTKGVELAVSVTPFTLFQRFRVKLQANNALKILLMEVRREYSGDTNKVILKSKEDTWNGTANIWETSIAPALEPFPFTSDVPVIIAFKNINNTIQIKVNGISYMFFQPHFPPAWADEVKIQDDVYLNRMDFYDTFNIL